VYFPRINGRMEWTAPDGVSQEATFEDRLTRELASQRLRTALDVSGEWLPTVLVQAHAQLMHLRARDPAAGGLVIAIDQEHARGIAGILEERLGVTPEVATSDDPRATERIARFGSGIAPWIVAVRMVSEGVDIPRLRVGVYATNTVTELFFRQAVGRLVRWSARLGRQGAYMFIPNDIRLRKFGVSIAEQRRHNLARPRREDELEDSGERAHAEPRTETERDLSEQLSLFAPISAVPLDEKGRPLDERGVYAADAGADDGDEPEGFIPDMIELGEAPFVLAASAGHARAGFGGPSPAAPPVPVPPPEPDAGPAGAPKTSALARRRTLREANSDVVRALVHLTGRTHADVNAELNRKIGIKRIGEATVRQLERRLAAAQAITRSRRT
jgi:hypothetical protein